MYKSGFIYFLVVMFAIISCEEKDLDLRSTSPTIRFSFYVADTARVPDSVFIHDANFMKVFSDSLHINTLPLRIPGNASDFSFYIDSKRTDFHLAYDMSLIDDIDKIRYDAYIRYASATSLDSLVLICATDTIQPNNFDVLLTLEPGDSINCTTNEATFRLFF